MKRNNKRALYESIMKNISKLVKRTLNEDIEDVLDDMNPKPKRIRNNFDIETAKENLALYDKLDEIKETNNVEDLLNTLFTMVLDNDIDLAYEFIDKY